MTKYLFFLVVFLSTVFEGIYSTFPLTLILILSFAVVKKEESVFLWAFFLGIVLDILNFRTVGETSLFFVCFLFLVFLYERKYEIATLPFVMVSSFIGSLLLLNLYGYQYVFYQSVLGSILAGLILFIVGKVKMGKSKRNYKMYPGGK